MKLVVQLAFSGAMLNLSIFISKMIIFFRTKISVSYDILWACNKTVHLVCFLQKTCTVSVIYIASLFKFVLICCLVHLKCLSGEQFKNLCLS